MKTETAFHKSLAFGLFFGERTVPLSLKRIPQFSVKFREFPSNFTPKSAQIVDLKARFSEFCCGIFPEKFPEVYISA